MLNFATLASKSVQSGSPEEIAYHLMVIISSGEQAKQQDKEYWLSLYEECLKATKKSSH